MEQPRRRTAVAMIGISLVGIAGLTTVTGRSRFFDYATVDVLELVASGVCFGIAFVGIVRTLRNMDSA